MLKRLANAIILPGAVIGMLALLAHFPRDHSIGETAREVVQQGRQLAADGLQQLQPSPIRPATLTGSAATVATSSRIAPSPPSSSGRGRGRTAAGLTDSCERFVTQLGGDGPLIEGVQCHDRRTGRTRIVQSTPVADF